MQVIIRIFILFLLLLNQSIFSQDCGGKHLIVLVGVPDTKDQEPLRSPAKHISFLNQHFTNMKCITLKLFYDSEATSENILNTINNNKEEKSILFYFTGHGDETKIFLSDKPYEEIAEITGITANYVAVKMNRIKEKFRTKVFR